MQDEQAEVDETGDPEGMDMESFEQRINQRFGPQQQWGRGQRLDDEAVQDAEGKCEHGGPLC